MRYIAWRTERLRRSEDELTKNLWTIIKSKTNIPACISAIVCAAVVLALFVWHEGSGKGTQTPEIVVFGDSLFAMYQDETGVFNRFAELTGYSVLDVSLGGTTMAFATEENRLAYNKDAFCMASLAQSIVGHDYRVQLNTEIKEPATGVFPGKMQALSQVDFDGVKLLIIEQGLNDYQMGIPLYPEVSLKADYSYLGALTNILVSIRNEYPKLQILLVTPTYAWYPDQMQNCENREYGYGNLEQYVNAEMGLAEALGIPCIDLYHDFYAHESDELWTVYTDDGMHPNDDSRKRLAEYLAEAIEELGFPEE